MDRSFRGIGFSDERRFSVRRATSDIIAALNAGNVEQCRQQTRRGTYMIREVWIESLGFWVPFDARIIHATLRGFAYPSAVQRERIKRAMRRWIAANGITGKSRAEIEEYMRHG